MTGGAVLSSPKALGVVRYPFSVHSDARLPVSHRLSDTETSGRARSLTTAIQPLPFTVTHTATPEEEDDTACTLTEDRLLFETWQQVRT